MFSPVSKKSDLHTSSPLSKTGTEERSDKRKKEINLVHIVNSSFKCARQLFQGPSIQGNTPNVSNIYQLPLLTINPLYTLQIETLLQHIEKIALNSNYSLEEVRTIVFTLLHSDKSEVDVYMRAELQLIAFYLDRDKSLPVLNGWVSHYNSFLEFRIGELLTEIKYLKSEAEEQKELKNVIAFGKNYYLRRAFARMAVTSHLYEDSPLYLGTAAQYIILKEFTHLTAPILNLFDEESLHFLTLTTLELQDILKYQAILGQKIEIADNIKYFFRLTHLLPSEATITPSLAAQGLMMALLFNTYQTFPNCFAFVTETYTKKNHTFLYLKKMVEWFKEGAIKIEGSASFPIDLLAGHRFLYEPILEHSVDQPQRGLSSSLQHILQVQGMQMDEELFNEPKTLRDILKFILQKHHQYEKMSYIAESYHTLSYDPLVSLTAAIIEFHSLNFAKINLNSFSFSRKQFYISLFMQFMGAEIKQHTNLTNKCIANISKLFCMSCEFNNNISTNGSDIIISKIRDHTVSSPENLSLLTLLFKQPIAFWALNEGGYSSIERISELSDYIKKALLQTLDSMEMIDSAALYESINNYKEFEVNFCNYFSRGLKKVFQLEISPDILKKIDLCLLPFEGGNTFFSLNCAYNIQARLVEIGSNSLTLSELMNSFTAQLQKKAAPSDFMISSANHVWIYYSSSPFNNYNNEPFSLIANQKIISRGVKKLNSPLNKGFLRDFFKKVTFLPHIELAKKIDKYNKSKLQLFIEKIYEDKDLVTPLNNLYGIINLEIYKTQLNLKHLKTINQDFGFPLGKEHEKVIALKNYLTTKSSSSVTARQLSLLIRKFILKNAHIALNSLQIEERICEMRNIPSSFYLGNSNWSARKYIDSLDPEIFSIRYDFVNDEIGIVAESCNSIKFLHPESFIKKFTLISQIN